MGRATKYIGLFALSFVTTVSYVYLNKEVEPSQQIVIESFEARPEPIDRKENFEVPIVEEIDQKVYNKSIKTVLFWTKFFSYPLWTLPTTAFEEGYLEKIGCPTTNCRFTRNRTLLDHPNDYAAILFHLPEPKEYLLDFPKSRDPHQVYVMVSKECPSRIYHNMDEERNFYNLTMSYRLDSDITWLYGMTYDTKTGRQIAPSMDIQWKEPEDNFTDSSILKLAEAKTKAAAWFVSHCNAVSKRDQLVKKIQEYIDVDIYGKCGTFQCKRGSPQCNEMLNSTYKFYFSFENTLCVDYVTEKVYDSMAHFIIPVIYSGAELSRFLPPKSYINVEDFKTAKDLADHLTFLSNNPSEYIKYFWWKKYYKIISRNPVNVCQICQKLNEPNLSAKIQIYESIKDWFVNDMCRPPKISF